jgi:hypothetical protein
MNNMNGIIEEDNFIRVNFNDANEVGILFGSISLRDFCYVACVKCEIKDLFMRSFEDFNFPFPTNDKIRADYVPSAVNGIDITWNPGHNQRGDFAGINQAHRDNIFLTFPIRGMSAKQLLTHELGHWYFNRLIEELIGADDRHRCREDINGYETNYAERVALYCEIKLAGRRDNYTSHDLNLVQNIERIEEKGQDVLQAIRDECMQQWEKQQGTE